MTLALVSQGDHSRRAEFYEGLTDPGSRATSHRSCMRMNETEVVVMASIRCRRSQLERVQMKQLSRQRTTGLDDLDLRYP